MSMADYLTSQGVLTQDDARALYDRIAASRGNRPLGDVAPGVTGGEFLTGVWDNMSPLDKAALLSAPVPVVGDILGLAADASMYWNEPESRTPANFALTAAGALPGVPALAMASGALRRRSDADRLARLLDEAGLYYERKGSGLSGSQYFDVKPAIEDASNLKVRVSDHVLPPSYEGVHGRADFEIGDYETAFPFMEQVPKIFGSLGADTPKSFKSAAKRAATLKAKADARAQAVASDIAAQAARRQEARQIALDQLRSRKSDIRSVFKLPPGPDREMAYNQLVSEFEYKPSKGELREIAGLGRRR